MRNFKLPQNKNQDGLVALFVVSIMVILLSLTTVAFTKLMGRESRQALDRVLSTQAYYSAQSGINDAQDYLSKNPAGVLASGNCGALAALGYAPYLGPSTTVTPNIDKVTCVSADSSPNQLFFQIPAGQSRIFKMSLASGTFNRVLFSWDNSSAVGPTYTANNYKNAGTGFMTDAAWNATPGGATNTKAPVLEVTYYPLPNTAQSMSALQSRARTIYLYPSKAAAGTTANYDASTTPDGKIVGPACQTDTDLNVIGVFDGASSVFHCNAIVKPIITPSFGGATNPQAMLVKISAFYGPASVDVRATDSATNNSVGINGAQAVLDSTGQGGTDQLKRLQTVIDYRPNNIEPGDTIETVTGLCKRLVYNLTTGSTQVDDPIPDSDTSPACHTTGSDPL